MTRDATVVVHFKDVERSEELSDAVEKRCLTMAEEFTEVDRFEVSVTPDRNDTSVHVRASGKGTDVAAHASEAHEITAADSALDRLERELRNRHDKRIFTLRREAKKAKHSRKTG
jgi:ribosome-associated translation inhibitor RaiA